MSANNKPIEAIHGTLVVVVAYAFFAGLRILLFSDPETLVRVSMLKGWFFVGVTSLLLYLLVRRLIGQLAAAEAELIARNAELEHFNHAMVGRELDMIGMERTINALSQELGRALPYDLAFIDGPIAKETP